jgi:hypothetical protein
MRRLALGIAIGLVLAGTAVAAAAIPDSNGVIHACRDLRSGVLRVIDNEAGQSCTNKEAELTWNQTGPQGPPGLSGYEVVVHDEQFIGAYWRRITARCPEGKRALGGSVATSPTPQFDFDAAGGYNSFYPTELTADSYTTLVYGSANYWHTARVVVTCAHTG